MAKKKTKSIEQIIADLDARQLSYSMDDDIETLKKILDDAIEQEVAAEKEANNIKINRVPLGVGTVNDHERRITILEAKIEKLAGK